MSAPAPASPKKKARKPKKPAAHPPVAKMVIAAITALKDRKGSSLQAIKKYIAANYKFDVNKQGHVIRRVVRNMLAKGMLTQARGKGAAGSFRLGAAAKKAPKKPKKAKKPKKKRAKKPKKARKPKAKKAKKPKAKKAKKAKKPAAKKARKPAKKTKRAAKK